MENVKLEEGYNKLYLKVLDKKLDVVNFCKELYTPTEEQLKQHIAVVKLSKTIVKGQGKTNLYLTEQPIDNSSIEILYAGMTMYYTVIVAGRKDTKEFSQKLANNGTRYYRRDVINGHNTLLELLERCIWGKVKYAYALYAYQQDNELSYVLKGNMLKSIGYYTSLIGEKVSEVYDCTRYDFKGNPITWCRYRRIKTVTGKEYLASNESGKYQIIKQY